MQSKYTGGTVMHIFMGERIKDTEALKIFIKTVCENYSLPYFSITPTFSVCPKCGYLEGEQQECPKCKSKKYKEIDQQIKSLENMFYMQTASIN
jgi:ribonucleoside-triphosphate reductase